MGAGTGGRGLEAEDDAPVGANRHGPETGEVSSEAVKPEAWEVHVVGAGRGIESGQDVRWQESALGADRLEFLVGPGIWVSVSVPPDQDESEPPIHKRLKNGSFSRRCGS